MKTQPRVLGITLATLIFFLTGCYTQLQTLDYATSANNRGIHRDYNSWGDNNIDRSSGEAESSPKTTSTKVVPNKTEADGALTEDELIASGIYYKDYASAEWYAENYADKVYWEGYEDGYDDGFDEAEEIASYHYWDAHFYSLKRLHHRRFNHFSLNYAWRGHIAFSYYPYYYNDYYWYGYNASYYYWSGYRYPIWGFHDPFWDPWFYADFGYGYYGSQYRPYIAVYNDYHRTTRSRSGRHYDGPRSTGLVSLGNGNQNAGVTRNRGDDSIQSKNSGRTVAGVTNTGRTRTNSGITTRYTGRTSTSTSTTRGVTRTVSDGSKEAISTNRSRREQARTVTGSSSNRTRSTGVTNRSRSNNNSNSVRTNSNTNRTRSTNVQNSNRSGGNNRSVRSSSGSRSRSSSVRSNSGSNRTRSSGNRSSSSRSRSRSGGSN